MSLRTDLAPYHTLVNRIPEVFDPQVNGALETSFNMRDLTIGDLAHVDHFWREEKRTNQYLPTVVTTSIERYAHVLPLLADLIESSPSAMGIHCEGPFISKQAKGAHPEGYIIENCDLDLARKLLEYGQGKIVLMTIAPELPGALDLTKFLIDNGVAVSLGHTAASLAEWDAYLRGISAIGADINVGLTHIPNAWQKNYDRDEMLILPYLLSQENTFPMVITDNRHRPKTADVLAQLTYSIAGEDAMIVTSDAAPIVGLLADPNREVLCFDGATKCTILPSDTDKTNEDYPDGRYPDDGFNNLSTLVGSPLSMRECLAYAGYFLGLDPTSKDSITTLEKLGFLNVREFLREPLERIGKF